MPSFPFTTVDVFTTSRYTGNPLAIVRLPADHHVTTEQMQSVAKEFNLSETVFIHEPSDSRQKPRDGVPEWRLRIFMTQAELPFAGHPTIGSACFALGTLGNGAKKGRLLCNAGPIDVDYEDGVARASIPHNFHHHQEHPVTVEDVWKLQPSLKEAGVGLKDMDVVSPVKGMNFIAVRLDSLEDLGRVAVSGVKPEARLDEAWDVGFSGSYFYVTESSEGGVTKVRTRMIEGSMEDPATGSAACGLCCFLALKERVSGQVHRFEVVQGVEMGRRSEIGVEVTLEQSADRLVVGKVVLSGSVVTVMKGTIEM